MESNYSVMKPFRFRITCWTIYSPQKSYIWTFRKASTRPRWPGDNFGKSQESQVWCLKDFQESKSKPNIYRQIPDCFSPYSRITTRKTFCSGKHTTRCLPFSLRLPG